MIYIGIDPGKSGGIAWVFDTGAGGALPMPATERDVLDLLGELAINNDPPAAHALIEQVGVMPKQGIVSAFTFGRNVGGLQMALTAARIPFDQVLPAKWQLALQCRTGGDKNVTKRRAQQLFPTLKVTHAIADALLIAEYCRRVHRVTDGKEESGAAQEHTQAAAGKTHTRPRREAGRKIERRDGVSFVSISAAEARTAIGQPARHGAGPRRASR